MKHLKSFNESNEDKSYEKITEADFDIVFADEFDEEPDIDNKLNLNDNDISTINKIKNKYFFTIDSDDKSHLYLTRNISEIRKSSYLSGSIMKIELSIYKLKDEWFYIREYTHGGTRDPKLTYYRCDQLEGLISLIRDEMLKN